MSEKLVEVAAFSLPVEAHAAAGLLESEGIKTAVSGAETVNVFSGVQGLGGKITLHVAESDAERAAALLAAHFESPADEAVLPPVDDEPIWVCGLCGDAVSNDLLECPACHTARPEAPPSRAVTGAPRRSNRASQDIQEERPAEQGQVTADTPVEAVPSAVEDDLDIPDPETFLGDDLVRRAFRSALFGVLFVPITFYSFWLLARLAFYSGKINPRFMSRLYGAIALNVLVCLAWLGPFIILFQRFFQR